MYPSRNKCSNKKSAEVDDHRSTGLVYVCVCLVSRSHFADLKMADPANAWDLPINIYCFRCVGVASKPTKALHANNWSSLAKDETFGPFVATCSSVRKNDEKNKNKNKNNLKMVLVLRSYTFSPKILKFFKEIGLQRV